MNTKNEIHLSVISPVYGCRVCLYELYYRLNETLREITPNFEIILINDASPDGAWDSIIELSANDRRVKGIDLSRNFGQHYAIAAGLDYCKGEWVVVMDCDLQDRPEEILKLYNQAIKGYDVVYGQRTERQDGLITKLSSKGFYKTLSFLTDSKQDSSIANFGIYKREIIDEIKKMGDKLKYFPIMVRWLGFKTVSIPVAHDKRTKGETTYSFSKKLNLALDVILSFSEKPLKLIIKGGLVVSFVSFIGALLFLIAALSGKISVVGYSSLIISIWFLAGVIITLIGIVGLYVGKTFAQVRDRQIYIIREFSNIEK